MCTQGSIVYTVEGEYPAESIFDVTPTTGGEAVVTTKLNLRYQTLGAPQYRVSVVRVERVMGVVHVERVMGVVCVERVSAVVCVKRVIGVVCVESVMTVLCVERVTAVVCVERVTAVVCVAAGDCGVRQPAHQPTGHTGVCH